MYKHLLLIIGIISYLVFIPMAAYSLPNIKIWATQLNDIDTTNIESSSYFYKLDYLVKEHLKTSYKDDLFKSLRQLSDVSVFNGDELVKSWRLDDPDILNNIDASHVGQKLVIPTNTILDTNASNGLAPAKEINAKVSVAKSGNASMPSAQQPNMPKQFLLIGFVKQILINQNQTQVFNTLMHSVIYTLEIITNYNLIDLATGEVVYQFSAVGYGGFARIYAVRSPPYKPELIVADATQNLAFDVTHIMNFELVNTNNLTPLRR